MRSNVRLSVVLLFAALFMGCASAPPEPEIEQTVADVQAFIASEQVTDDRGRFREVFCQVIETRGENLPDYRPCEQALRRLGPELGATGVSVSLGKTSADYLVLMVPGLGWNCFESFLDLSNSAPEHVAQYGYEFRMVPVDGLSSTANNARMIRDYIRLLPEEDVDRPIILAGYSKGSPDILEALVTYPEVASRVVAVISLAGAVAGSPLADDSEQATANLLTLVPGSTCEKEDGDNEAVVSLRPSVRQAWLDENALPAHISYYSVITFPERDRISWVLRDGHALVGMKDLRNDTQVIVFDQIIPGSTVAAVVNADHWAVAVPVARSHPLIGKTLVDKNDYPREAFLEAILRYVEENLQRPL